MIQIYDDKCNPSKNLYYAFCGGQCSIRGMSMKTTLRKCGKVRLKFGACYANGYVDATLNGKHIARARATYESKTIIFAFKDGDMLELTEMGQSILEFGYLNIISCSSCHDTRDTRVSVVTF